MSDIESDIESDIDEAIEETERLLRSQQALTEQFEGDPHRPGYHFMPPGGWLNDPTAAILWQGRYHLFYEYFPDAAYSVAEHEDGTHVHLDICWGHASSADLIHWVHHPIALSPSPDVLDGSSCFSGHIVDNDGVATIIYYGRPSGSCITTATDRQLNEWTRPQVVIPPAQEVEGSGPYGVGDPCLWREGTVWYALGGFRDPQGGDTASLFRSQDTLHWEFLHSLYTSDRKWTTAEDDCAVPDFFPLGDRHMLLFMSHETGAQYYLGRWENEHFYPETHGHMNWPGGQLNAPKSMLDANGRRLFWGWVCEGRTRAAQRAAGWAGVLSLPRELSLHADGELRIEPAVELERLRYNHRKRTDIHLGADGELDLPEMRGDCLELGLTVESDGAAELGIKLRCSPDGSEQTAIVWNPSNQTLSIDTRQSSLRTDILQPWPKPWSNLFSDPLAMFDDTRHIEVQEAPLSLTPEGPLELRVFLDRSVLEVFANGRQCLTQRIYPDRDDSLGTVLFSKGGRAVVRTIEAWDMAAIGT
jgi:beta-fructofuranosidase